VVPEVAFKLLIVVPHVLKRFETKNSHLVEHIELELQRLKENGCKRNHEE
jgi:hypothetical protein